MPILSFNNAPFKDLMQKYATIREKTIPDSIRLHARLLCVELAMRTQPFGKNESDVKSGEGAIRRDLLGRAMQRAGLFGAVGIVTPYSTGNVRLYVFGGHAYGLDKTHYRPDAGEGDMRDFHKANFKDGKVTSAGSRTLDVGRWKFVEKMYVNKKTLGSYVNYVLDHVGIAKSGWSGCCELLPKVVAGSMTRGIPSWVTRHVRGSSEVIDRTDDPDNPSIVVKNLVPWASSVCPYQQVIVALTDVKIKAIKQLNYVLKSQGKEIPKLTES